jgi:hypothetical protein
MPSPRPSEEPFDETELSTAHTPSRWFDSPLLDATEDVIERVIFPSTMSLPMPWLTEESLR